MRRLRLELANPALANELLFFLDKAGFGADPDGVLPAGADDPRSRLALVRCLAAWNDLHPEGVVRLMESG